MLNYGTISSYTYSFHVSFVYSGCPYLGFALVSCGGDFNMIVYTMTLAFINHVSRLAAWQDGHFAVAMYKG